MHVCYTSCVYFDHCTNEIALTKYNEMINSYYDSQKTREMIETTTIPRTSNTMFINKWCTHKKLQYNEILMDRISVDTHINVKLILGSIAKKDRKYRESRLLFLLLYSCKSWKNISTLFLDYRIIKSIFIDMIMI